MYQTSLVYLLLPHVPTRRPPGGICPINPWLPRNFLNDQAGLLGRSFCVGISIETRRDEIKRTVSEFSLNETRLGSSYSLCIEPLDFRVSKFFSANFADDVLEPVEERSSGMSHKFYNELGNVLWIFITPISSFKRVNLFLMWIFKRVFFNALWNPDVSKYTKIVGRRNNY